jgi:hypothetical protein
MWKNTEKSILMDKIIFIHALYYKIYSYNIMKLSKRKYFSKTRKNKTFNLQGSSFNTNVRGGKKMTRKNIILQKQKRINKTKGGEPKESINSIINELNLDSNDIENITNYLKNEDYKKNGIMDGMNSQVASLFKNSQFIQYLTANNIFDKYKLVENPKKNVKIVFYSSKGRPNSLRKYPYFRVFIEDGNTLNDMMDQVDTSLSNIMDSGIKKRNELYTRSVNIEIEDLSKMLEKKMAKKKINKKLI